MNDVLNSGDAIRFNFVCDPSDGSIYVRQKPGFDERGKKIVNKMSSKRRMFYFRGRSYAWSRVVWLLCNGKWPSAQIDHIDGNFLNNAITNLRDVPARVNCKNLGIRASNKSGVTGVYWNKQCSKWMARIKVDGKWIYLGVHTALIDAACARKDAEIKYGFHKNHGRRPSVPKKRGAGQFSDVN